MAEIEARDRIAILIHYHRAMVGRADVWRTRMDTTTHWAIGATAAVLSFTLADPAMPHYVVWIAPILTAIFLMLEARRLTFYQLWQRRVLKLENAMVVPAVAGGEAPALDLEALEELGPELGRTVPGMPIGKAAARRLRRVYLYLFAIQLLAWGVKLANHPVPADGMDAFLARAGVGAVPGSALVAVATIGLVAAAALAWGRGGVDRTS